MRISDSKLWDHLNLHSLDTLIECMIVWKFPNMTKNISRWGPNSVPKDAAARQKHWLNDTESTYHGSAVCIHPKFNYSYEEKLFFVLIKNVSPCVFLHQLPYIEELILYDTNNANYRCMKLSFWVSRIILQPIS